MRVTSFQELFSHLDSEELNPEQTGDNQGSADCPKCRQPQSLRFSVDDAGHPLFDCESGCDPREVAAWLHLDSSPGDPLAHVPDELKQEPRWIHWKLLPRKEGKDTKVPVSPNGRQADAHNPSHWMTYEDAQEAFHDGKHSGLGFVFTESDELAGVDLDNCRDPQTGELAQWALEIIERLDSYTEISPSGTGVKVWIKTDEGIGGKKLEAPNGGAVEVYTQGRYFTVTGEKLSTCPAELREAELAWLLEEYGQPSPGQPTAFTSVERPAPGILPKPQSPSGLSKMDRVRAYIDKAEPAISGQNGHGKTFGVACRVIHGFDLSEAEGQEALRYYSERCEPPWTEREIRHKVRQALQADGTRGLLLAEEPGGELSNGGGEESRRGRQDEEGKSASQKIVEVVESNKVELFADQDGTPYASIRIGDHLETYKVGSKPFRDWIARQYHQDNGKVPTSQAISDAEGVIRGKALYESGKQYTVAIRLAEHDGAIYIDLANDNWEFVEITAQGWAIKRGDCPVRFRRTNAMKELPRPTQGHLESLRPFVNVGSDADFVLVAAWLVAACRPIGPYPVLCIHGPQGSSKSTVCRVLRSLIDPNKAPLRTATTSNRDIAIAAHNNWVVTFENVSSLSPAQSDAICRLATGGGFGTRGLYQDDEEWVMDAQRPTVLNGIPDFATRPDLLDRAIVLHLPEIQDSCRRPESEFWREFNQQAPSILGGLFNAVSHALQAWRDIHLDELPRMADFAKWAVAAEPRIHSGSPCFLAAYNEQALRSQDAALDDSPIVLPLVRFVERSAGLSWEGTATQLWEAITPGDKPPRNWPKNGQSLSGKLRRLSPFLRKRPGLAVVVTTIDTARPRTIHLQGKPEVDNDCVQRVGCVEPPENSTENADAIPTQYNFNASGISGGKNGGASHPTQPTRGLGVLDYGDDDGGELLL